MSQKFDVAQLVTMLTDDADLCETMRMEPSKEEAYRALAAALPGLLAGSPVSRGPTTELLAELRETYEDWMAMDEAPDADACSDQFGRLCLVIQELYSAPPSDTPSDSRPLAGYGVRKCRGHWHVVAYGGDGKEGDDLSVPGDPFPTLEAALDAAELLRLADIPSDSQRLIDAGNRLLALCAEPIRGENVSTRRAGRTHHLKTWPSFFGAMLRGDKTFEVRDNRDRDFAVGDTLHLMEFDPSLHGFNIPVGYTGRELTRYVTYVMLGGHFGIDINYCVLGCAASPAEASGGPSGSQP